jgi:hypothetical protein
VFYRFITTAAAVLFASAGLVAGTQAPALKGTTTSQKGAVRLAGVAVTVLDAQGKQIAAVQSNDEGQFSVPPLPAGRYTVVGNLSSFKETRRTVVVQPGVVVEVNLDLDVATTETVSVVVKEADPGFASSLASREVVAAKTAEQLPVGGESIQAALRVISSVTQQTGGVRIKGGRADQASLQFGRVIVNDPTGGSGMFRLPVDAVDAIEVLPNPYGAEFGGFSSGLIVIRPRTPPDKWTVQPNGWPSFLTARDNPFDPVALREFTPRVVFGGPLRQRRMSLLVSALASYRSEQVWSRPQTERRNTTEGSLFARARWPRGRPACAERDIRNFSQRRHASGLGHVHPAGGDDRPAPAGDDGRARGHLPDSAGDHAREHGGVRAFQLARERPGVGDDGPDAGRGLREFL